MPQFSHLYRAVRARCVYTHKSVCPQGGPPAASCPHQRNTALADTEAAGHQPDRALSGRAQDKQRRPVPRGWPQEVPCLCWASSPRPWCTLQARILHAAWKGLSPHVFVCHLHPVPCASSSQRAWSLCPQRLAWGPARSRCLVSLVGMVSVCTLFSGLHTAGSGSTEAAGAGRPTAQRATWSPSLGQACVGGNPAPVTRSRLVEPARLHIP